MNTHRTDTKTVTLLLHNPQGEPWRLNLAMDCLRFVGHYRRVEGFNIDAVLALDGLRRQG